MFWRFFRIWGISLVSVPFQELLGELHLLRKLYVAVALQGVLLVFFVVVVVRSSFFIAMNNSKLKIRNIEKK
jgi:hypothetical protein